MYSFEPILNRIKLIKKELKMTNEALSSKSGVPAGTLNKILSGDTKEPKLPAIIAIANALNVSSDYLIYGRNAEDEKKDAATDENLAPATENSGIIFSGDEKELLETYRNFSEEGREKVLDYVRDLERTGLYIKNSENRVDKKK